MNIKGLGPKIFVNDEKPKVRQNKESENSKRDKLEISQEAKLLQGKSEVKELSDVKKRVNNKFYDSKEVVDKIADKILKELRK